MTKNFIILKDTQGVLCFPVLLDSIHFLLCAILWTLHPPTIIKQHSTTHSETAKCPSQSFTQGPPNLNPSVRKKYIHVKKSIGNHHQCFVVISRGNQIVKNCLHDTLESLRFFIIRLWIYHTHIPDSCIFNFICVKCHNVIFKNYKILLWSCDHSYGLLSLEKIYCLRDILTNVVSMYLMSYNNVIKVWDHLQWILDTTYISQQVR